MCHLASLFGGRGGWAPRGVSAQGSAQRGAPWRHRVGGLLGGPRLKDLAVEAELGLGCPETSAPLCEVTEIGVGAPQEADPWVRWVISGCFLHLVLSKAPGVASCRGQAPAFPTTICPSLALPQSPKRPDCPASGVTQKALRKLQL